MYTAYANGQESGTKEDHACNENTRDLSTDELRAQYNAWLSEDTYMSAPFYIHQSLARRLKSKSAMTQNLSRYRVRHTLLFGNRKCKINKKSTQLMERSTCPWYLEANFDKQRYPQNLVNARCKCPRRCLQMKSKHGKCEPMVIKMKVLRRDLSDSGVPLCSNGLAIYSNTWEDIAVGCTCEIRKRYKQKKTVVPK